MFLKEAQNLIINCSGMIYEGSEWYFVSKDQWASYFSAGLTLETWLKVYCVPCIVMFLAYARRACASICGYSGSSKIANSRDMLQWLTSQAFEQFILYPKAFYDLNITWNWRHEWSFLRSLMAEPENNHFLKIEKYHGFIELQLFWYEAFEMIFIGCET